MALNATLYMEDNELQEEVIDSEETQSEETQTDDVVEDDAYANKTIEDFKELEKKAKTLEQQKEHWRKKATKETPLKTNETSNSLTREEVILIAKGVSEDVINEANDVARAKGITLSEAMKTPLISAFIKEKEAEEKRSKAQLGSSNYSGKTGSKDISQAVGMTEEEHRKSIGM